MQRVQRSNLLTAALIAGCALAGAANAQVIRITNVNGATGHDIPLKANSSVQIDSAGNLLAECALNANSQCAALSSGGPTGSSPTASLTRTDNDSDVRVGESVTLQWSSTNAEVCKSATTGAGTSIFVGPQAASGSVVAPVSVVGTYEFSLLCYGAGGASTAVTASAVVAAASGGGNPNPQPEGCDITSSDAAFNPSNFAKVERAWSQVFSAPDGSPQATYPNGVSFPTPVGASKGTYVVVPFQPNASQSVVMYWDQIQPRPQDGYANARPADGMFFAISPCKGDLRRWSGASASDPWLRPGCRKFENAAGLVWTTSSAYPSSNENVCKLEAGRTYYLHVLPADPTDGLTTGEHSCTGAANSANGCDVGVVFQTSSGG